MSYTTTDPSGGYFDPNTGMYVPAGGGKPFTPASTTLSNLGSSIWNALKGGNNQGAPTVAGSDTPSAATVPSFNNPTPPTQAPPPAPPQAAPQAPPPQAPVAAAMGAPQAPPPPAPAPVAQALQQPPQVAPQQALPDVTQGDTGTLNIKRNNPLNIRFAGQPGATNDGGFASYPTVQDGYNAATSLMGKYADGGINTLSGLISKWAPPSENNTAAYIANVSKATGIDPNAKIDLHDPAVVGRITPVMARMESGVGGSGGAPGAPGPTIAQTSTQPQAGPDQAQQPGQTMAAGYDPATDPAVARVKALADAFGVKPMSTSDKLLAMASGFLGGNGPAKSLAGGLGAIPAMNQEDRKQAMQLADLGIQSQYHDALLGMSAGRLGVQQAGLGIRQGSLDNQINRTNNQANAITQRFSPQTAAALTQSKTAGQDAEKDIQATMSSQQSDEQAMKDTQDAQALIQQNPSMMGPTLINRGTRALAEMGIAGDPNTLNALQKMTADQRNTYLSSLTGGHVGGIRSNQELKNLSAAVADVNTSPQAAQWIIKMQQQQIQGRQAWRNELQSRSQSPEGLDSITGRQYNMTKNAFFNDYYGKNPLPDYGSTGAQAAAPAPGVTPQGGTKGVAPTLRYDQASGQMVPMQQ